MSEGQKMARVASLLVNFAAYVHENSALNSSEYLEFVKGVEFLKKSEAFQESSACFKNYDQSMRIVWDVPEKYTIAAAYLAVQKMTNNAIPINFCELTAGQFAVLKGCAVFLRDIESDPSDPQAKRICM